MPCTFFLFTITLRLNPSKNSSIFPMRSLHWNSTRHSMTTNPYCSLKLDHQYRSPRPLISLINRCDFQVGGRAALRRRRDPQIANVIEAENKRMAGVENTGLNNSGIEVVALEGAVAHMSVTDTLDRHKGRMGKRSFKELVGPRWKGTEAKAKADADPMSKIVSKLKSSLIQSVFKGKFSGSSVLLGADTEQTELLLRASFGQPIITVDKKKQWFQLGMEEAFYLCYSLRCFKIVGDGNCIQTDETLWKYMISRSEAFPDIFKAYSHLRSKNWVVRPGSLYGVDFVAYRHHPSLVHSEYCVLVLSEGDGDANGRLRVWSDYMCTLRVCGAVAKTLLALYINRNGKNALSPSCLEGYSVEERIITRWGPEQRREDKSKLETKAK